MGAATASAHANFFFEFADALCAQLQRDETLLVNYAAERSDFVRFNHAQVRQAGTVDQRFVTVRLIHAGRQISETLTLSGDADDRGLGLASLTRLRELVGQLPVDPWLALAEEPKSTTTLRPGKLPPAEEIVAQVVQAAGKHDLVGFYAAGPIFRGFTNSLGQRNWHETTSFNFDWSLYLAGDKAVKSSLAGFEWQQSVFEQKLTAAAMQLEQLAQPARTLSPGEYRVYLAPGALDEIASMLSWGGFSARARETKQSALLRMESGAALASAVTLTENSREGLSPIFQGDGFVRPDVVPLITAGRLGDPLVSPRSGREYHRVPNGANGRESPESLDLAAGDLPMADALAALDTGLFINNLWYLNFSDRPAGRMTGMTRFATFWVEHGQIVAPVNVMRFDDTIYRMLGSELAGLTCERELIVDTGTYSQRSTGCSRLPGALLRSLKLTL